MLASAYKSWETEEDVPRELAAGISGDDGRSQECKRRRELQQQRYAV
jgi:hypothetical protein